MASPTTPDAETVLRTEGLTKRYGSLVALNGVDLQVQRGTVYGFLGPNGAGKTTAISIILGLLGATSGRVEMLGLDMGTRRREALRRTGAILEGQAYYPLLSARDNLRIWRALYDDVSEQRIDEVLDLVGLLPRAGSKVRTYSLGMKQRLGLAGALLHDPELLVLDEPTNGLDPAGMREFRNLISELGRSGKTVFVSSHLLGEVEQMCTYVGIVKSGRLLTQGPVGTLVSQSGGLELRTTDAPKAEGVLAALEFVASVARDGEVLSVEAPQERAADISRALADQQVYLHELRRREGTLEDFFLEVTAEQDANS